MPFFREIVGQCVALLQEGLQGKRFTELRSFVSEFDFQDLSNDTTSVLHGLLTSLSPFWAASEISQVVLLYINQHKNDDSLAGFVKALTKRAPEKILIPTLPQIWSSLLKSSPSSVGLITIACWSTTHVFRIRTTCSSILSRGRCGRRTRALFKRTCVLFSICFWRRSMLSSYRDQ